MAAKSIRKIIKPYLKPFNLVIALIVGTVALVGLIILVQRLVGPKTGTIRPDQIKIQKGEKIVIVNENGLIEYHSKSGVYYDTWDSFKVDDFFRSMREMARDYLADPSPATGGDCYYVTLYIDGEEVTFCVEDSELLDEIYEEFPENGDGLGDLLDDYFGDGDGDGQGQDDSQDQDDQGVATPTPTSTPDEGGDGIHDDFELGLFDCSLYEQQVTGRTVISNTLCILEQEE